MGFNQTVDSLLNLTGIAPLRGSRAALPIACDASNARTMAVRELSSLLCHDRMPSDVFQPDIFLINRKLIYTAKMGWPVMRVAALRKYTADVAAITPKEDQT